MRLTEEMVTQAQRLEVRAGLYASAGERTLARTLCDAAHRLRDAAKSLNDATLAETVAKVAG